MENRFEIVNGMMVWRRKGGKMAEARKLLVQPDGIYVFVDGGFLKYSREWVWSEYTDKDPYGVVVPSKVEIKTGVDNVSSVLEANPLFADAQKKEEFKPYLLYYWDYEGQGFKLFATKDDMDLWVNKMYANGNDFEVKFAGRIAEEYEYVGVEVVKKWESREKGV